MNEVQGFILEGSGVRGAVVRLEETWADRYFEPPRCAGGNGA